MPHLVCALAMSAALCARQAELTLVGEVTRFDVPTLMLVAVDYSCSPTFKSALLRATSERCDRTKSTATRVDQSSSCLTVLCEQLRFY